MLKRVALSSILFAVTVVVAPPIQAQAPTPDHLKCYTIKDPLARTRYTADLGGLVAEPGCKIQVPAIMACVPSTKANVTPTPPGGGGSGIPNSYFCYRVRCKREALPTLAGQDQFGARTVTPTRPAVICAPLAPTPATAGCVEIDCPCNSVGSSITCAYHGTCADPNLEPSVLCPLDCAGSGGWSGQGTCKAPSSSQCTGDPNCVP
jgi:hypothetical protein